MRDSLGWRARALSAEISGASSVAGAVFLDVCALTGQQFRADPGRLFAADRYHPGAEGQALLAETVTPALRDLLR
jgi:phospholipase/lecithinase/hemolysin